MSKNKYVSSYSPKYKESRVVLPNWPLVFKTGEFMGGVHRLRRMGCAGYA